MAPFMPWKAGAFSGGTRRLMMIKAPENKAAAPTPEMARPTMNATEDGASAVMSEPISKMMSADMKTHLAEYRE